MAADIAALKRAKAMVAGESALMRLRARANVADAVTRQIEGLADTPEFDDILTASDLWLCQQAGEIARDEYARKLVVEYEGGRR